MKEEIKVIKEINGEGKIQIGIKEAREVKADGTKEAREDKVDGTKEVREAKVAKVDGIKGAKADGVKEDRGVKVVKTIRAGETQEMFNLEVIFPKHLWERLIYWLRRVSNEIGMIRKSKYEVLMS